MAEANLQEYLRWGEGGCSRKRGGYLLTRFSLCVLAAELSAGDGALRELLREFSGASFLERARVDSSGSLGL